ncbi:hypothetical protein HHSLTHF2_30960 [Vreelandella venusta]|uniref:Uncharacterized protein n=1 Tax=Halomonas hydrothermalis TaxID=115561 RepID=A0A6F8U7V6_9GAMM|nr:hypothetical protein HHSLTHF2_30960 [Halomonas hydrothermalis]
MHHQMARRHGKLTRLHQSPISNKDNGNKINHTLLNHISFTPNTGPQRLIQPVDHKQYNNSTDHLNKNLKTE